MVEEDVSYLGKRYSSVMCIHWDKEPDMSFLDFRKERKDLDFDRVWKKYQSEKLFKCDKKDHIETVINELKKIDKRGLLNRFGFKKKKVNDYFKRRIYSQRMEGLYSGDSVFEGLSKNRKTSKQLVTGFKCLEEILNSPEIAGVLFDVVDDYESSEENRGELYYTIESLNEISRMPEESHKLIRKIYESFKKVYEIKYKGTGSNFEINAHALRTVLSPLIRNFSLTADYNFDFFKIANSPLKGLESGNYELINEFILPWFSELLNKRMFETYQDALETLQGMIDMGKKSIDEGFLIKMKTDEDLDAVQLLSDNISSYSKEEQELAIRFFERGSKRYRFGSDEEDNQEELREILDSQTVSNAIRIVLSDNGNKKDDGSLDEKIIEECARIHNTRPDTPYLILNRLGHGASGTVYKAHSKFLNERVAIKLMEKSNHEAMILAILKNKDLENIVKVNDAGYLIRTPEGKKYTIVMEYVKGNTLAMEIKEGKTKDKTLAREYLKGILKGLEVLGEEGISYRDLRPANIIIRDGKPVIIDFGNAEKMDNYPAEKNGSRTFSWFDDLFSFGLLAYNVVCGEDRHLLSDYEKKNPSLGDSTFLPNRGINTNKDWINLNKRIILNDDGNVSNDYEVFIKENIKEDGISRAILTSLGYLGRINGDKKNHLGEIMSVDELGRKKVDYDTIKRIRQGLFEELNYYIGNHNNIISLVRN